VTKRGDFQREIADYPAIFNADFARRLQVLFMMANGTKNNGLSADFQDDTNVDFQISLPLYAPWTVHSAQPMPHPKKWEI
jgi:hypothetical protein